jgi:hexosaminidase
MPIFLLPLVLASAQEAELPLVPMPAHVRSLPGSFHLGADTVLTDNARSADGTLNYARTVLAPATRFALKKGRVGSSTSIEFELKPGLSELGDEGYRLTVGGREVKITAAKTAGLFYGVQTLRQLFPPAIYSKTMQPGMDWSAPCVEIEDVPRFGWRGLMLDVSRHFEPMPVIERLLDTMAAHKMNRFHWHLVDDPGWRIEIKRYPNLTKFGTTENWDTFSKPGAGPGHNFGGFYTQDQIREIVAYARMLHIVVVPEIEMPGHSGAAIASYPEIGVWEKPHPAETWHFESSNLNVDDSTVKFYQNILDEVMQLFPSPWIHVGGDEVDKAPWKRNAHIQALMRQRGLKDENEQQSWFIRQMDHYLTSHGRRLIGWDEILEGGLAQNATVMSWRGIDGGIAAAKAGHDVVMSPTSHLYFDYLQGPAASEPRGIGGNLPLAKVYSYEPIPDVLTPDQAKHVLGAQGNIWTEYIPTARHMEYMAWPRGCALSELAWSPKSAKDYGDFLGRLRVDLRRLDAMGVNYRKLTP